MYLYRFLGKGSLARYQLVQVSVKGRKDHSHERYHHRVATSYDSKVRNQVRQSDRQESY